MTCPPTALRRLMTDTMKAQAVTEIPVQLHEPDFFKVKTGQKNPQYSRFMYVVSCTPSTEVAPNTCCATHTHTHTHTHTQTYI